VPVAVNCCVVPAAIEGFCGFTCMEVRLATTLKLVEPVSAPKAAAMVAFPIARAVACPLPLTRCYSRIRRTPCGGGGQIVGCTVAIGSYSVELLRSPAAIEGLTGVTAIDCRVGLHIPPLNAL